MKITDFEKYNISVPRYTSYPVITDWAGFKPLDWIYSLINGYTLEIDLYIHIPFCEKLCYYCGCFRTITKNKDRADKYIDKLKKEWEIYTKLFPHIKIKSLHLGGGTPSFLTPNQMHRLLSILTPYKSKDFSGNIELDPRTAKDEHIKILSEYGFRSASLGIQDFDLEVQEAINRIQSFELVSALVEKLRANMFNEINFDLIWGLPKQTKKTVTESFKKVLKLRPQRISYYSYAHLPDRIKNQRLIKEQDILMGKEKGELFSIAKNILLDDDYIAIGMDHYALKGSELACAYENKKLHRNFMGYVSHKSDALIGLGVSAISQSSSGYVQNTKDLKDYEEILNKGQLPLVKGHQLNNEEAFRATIIQEIFCHGIISKVDISQLTNKLDVSKQLDQYVKDGFMDESQKAYIVNELGFQFIRVIASVFDQYRTKTYQFSKAI